MSDFNFGEKFEEEKKSLESESLKSDVKELQPEMNRVQALPLKSGDISFDVRNSDRMLLSSSAAVSIVTITNGYNGQLFSLIFDDSNVTLVHDATGGRDTLNLGGSNFTGANGNVINLLFNGTSWLLVKTILSNVQTFLSSGTWTKPSFGIMATIQLWGAGGSGGRSSSGNAGGGGGGGAYAEITVPLSTLGATETVTLGAGGTAVSVDNTDGNQGGDSTFSSILTAYGGGGGSGDLVTTGAGGGGGGTTSAGASTINATGGAGGNPLGGAGGIGAGNSGTESLFGGGGGGGGGTTAGDGGASLYGGGGGGGADDNSANSKAGGSSKYGGGGGGGGADTAQGGDGGIGGTSQFGGSGGAGNSHSVNATDGTQPGGGGGGTETGTTGAGGRGKCVVIVF